jgi:hypothetical protein
MTLFTYSFSTGPLRLIVSVDGSQILSFTPNNSRLLIGHLKANPGTTFYEGDPPNGEFSFGLSPDRQHVEWTSGNYMQDAFGTLTNRTPVDPSFYEMLAAIAKL